MVWLPEGEKFLKICLFISTESMNVTDAYRQTDGRTPHDGIGRALAYLYIKKLSAFWGGFTPQTL